MELPRPYGLYRGLTLAAVPAANIGFVLFCVAWAWPNWWEQINDEESALTWFSSCQLLVCGLTCLAIAFLRKVEGAKPRLSLDAYVWPLLSAAFFFLSVDERFMIHERLREQVFKPSGAEVPGVNPGDFATILYAAGGLAVATRLWGLMGRQARFLFGLGLAAASTAVVIDTANFLGGDHLVKQFLDELLETTAQMFFLTAFVAQFWEHAKGLVAPRRA